MGRRLAMVLALVALLVAAAWLALSSDPDGAAPPTRPDDPATARDDGVAERRRVAGAPGSTDAETTTPDGADTAGPPEDAPEIEEYEPTVVRLDAAATTTLCGIVVTHEGRPVPGAEVTARSTWMPIDVLYEDPATPSWTGRTRTNDAGRFSLDVALGGPIDVAVAAFDRSAFWTGHVRNPHATLEVMLPAAEDLALGGRVVDEEGRPVEGAHVYVDPDTRHGRGRPIESKPVAFTDADGRWAWTAEAAGRYAVRVRKDGYAPARPWVHIAAPGWDETPETVLRRGVRVRGIVLDDETERPVEGARLTWNRERSGVFAHTARDGTFELHVEARTVSQRLAATADGFVPRFTSLVSGRITPDAEPVVLRLQRPGTLVARCVDAGGAPVVDVTAIVTATSHGTRVVRAVVAPDGSLRVEGLPPAPAEVAIVFQVGGIQVLERTFPAPAARGTYDAGDVVLPSTSVLRGTLVRSDGGPAAEGWVVAARADPADPGLSALADAASSWDRHFSRCDDQGRFALPGLTPGVWDLLAWGRGLPPLLQRGVVVPTEGGAPELALRMPPPLRLRVRVVDAEGAPVGEAGVVVWREHPLRFGYADGDVTDDEGRAAFDGFAPDVPRVWVEVELPDGDRGTWVDPRAGEAELSVPDLRERDPDERP